MGPISLYSAAAALIGLAAASSKRGLVFVPDSDFPNDYRIWEEGDLSWYYNYGATPSVQYSDNSSFQFVPMLWGAPPSTSDTSFVSTVQAQIQEGFNISYVLSFNEPDGVDSGGSNVDPTLAAQTWVREIAPLAQQGIKLGAPAVTGGYSGWTWLQEFFTACNGNCSADFIPVHWYGNYEGFVSHLEQVQNTYPNMSVWVTEYGYPDQTLADTEAFFNQTIDYMEGNDNITHYSYFGAFRANVSNVGANAAFLTNTGTLTQLGQWYMGRNIVIKSAAPARGVMFAGWSVLVATISLCIIL